MADATTWAADTAEFFAPMVESFAAWRFKQQRKARRQYQCRFCGKAIPAGSQYLAHSGQAAHIQCVEELRAVTPERGDPKV